MRVGDILNRKSTRIATIRMNETVATAARLLRDENISALVVKDVCRTEGNVAVGMFTERDVVRAIAQRDGATLEVQRRAALALGEHGDASLGSVLDAWAADSEAGEDARSRVITILGELRYTGAVRTLIALLAVAMWFGRFGVIVPVLAIAGSLAAKKRIAVTEGTLPTHGPLFVALLIGSVLLIGLLNYVPALALGPVVEHLMLWSH